MSDIRARLVADALREHQPSDNGFCTAEGCNWRYWPGHDHKEHQSAVLLSLPGIAIVDTEADFVERAAARMADADDAIMPKSFYERMARVALAAAIQAQEDAGGG